MFMGNSLIVEMGTKAYSYLRFLSCAQEVIIQTVVPKLVEVQVAVIGNLKSTVFLAAKI